MKGVKTICTIKHEWIDKIIDIKNQINPLTFMVGVWTTDGERFVPMYEDFLIDADIATSDAIGFHTDMNDNIVIERVKRINRR